MGKHFLIKLLSFEYFNWIKLAYYLLDHAFHFHLNLVENGGHHDLQADSSLRRTTESETNGYVSTPESDDSININFNGIETRKSFIFFHQATKFVIYHTNTKGKCLMKITSLFVCIYLMQDVLKSACFLFWFKRGYISQDCLRGELCSASQRKQLLVFRIFDMLVAQAHIMPEIHVLSILMTIPALVLTLHFTFFRDIHRNSSNAAVLYLQLLSFQKIQPSVEDDPACLKKNHRPSSKISSYPSGDHDILDVSFSFDEFQLIGYCGSKTKKWTISKKTLASMNKLMKVYIIGLIVSSISVWIINSGLIVHFYWTINTAAVTLEEEQLRVDFRPYVLWRTILSIVYVAFKTVYVDIYFAHFIHHMMCCVILKERFYATSMQCRKISRYLCNYKYIIEQHNSRKDNSSVGFFQTENYIYESCRFSTQFKRNSLYYQLNGNHLFPSSDQKYHKLSDMQQQNLPICDFQKLICSALDENCQCIGAVRKELEELRLHFKLFLTMEFLTKIPISILYFSSFLIANTGEGIQSAAKANTIYTGLVLIILFLPLIFYTGAVQKSVSSRRVA